MATISSEITSALEAEVAALVEVLFETFSDPEAIEDSALIADGLGRYISHVEQLGILARQGGFMGFQQLCVQFQGRLTLLANEENALSDGHRELLEEWPSLVMGYLESPANAELSDALIAHLENPLWPSLLIEAEPSALREALIRPSDTGFEQDDDGANLVEAEAEAVAEPSLSEISHQKLEQVETELGSVFENSVDAEINAAALDTSELEERAFQESDATLPIAVATEAPASAEAALESHPLVDDLISALPTPMVVETPAEPLTANGFAELVAPDVEEMEGSEDVYLEGSAAEAVPVAPGVVPAVVHEDAFPEVQLAEREGQLADLASTVSKTVEALSEAEREAVVVSPQFLESDPILKSVAIESSDGETVWLEAEVEQPAMADSSIISESMGIAESVLEPTEAEVSQPKEVEIAEAAVESREEATAVFEAGVQSLLHPTAALLEPELEPALPSEDEITDEDGAAAGLPGFDQELVELLQGELGSIIEATEDLKGIVLAPETDTEARLEVLSNYADQIARLADAAEALGLGGLQQVCAHLNGNVMALAAWGRPLDESEYQLLAAWPERALHYLQKLPDRSCSRALVQSLIYANWPDPLPVELATPLVELLAKPTFAIPEEMAVEARPQEATPEDVSLALPEDVNPELLDSLLQELPGQTAELSAAIQRLAAGNGVLRDVEVAQRIAHTVKGAGNTVGVRGIANLTHHMEDILQAFSKHKALPTRRLAETLLAATDCLENMSEALVGLGAPPTQARQVLQSILDWANRIDREGLPRDDAALPERVPTVAAVQTGKLPELVDVAEAPETVTAAATSAADTPQAAVPMLRVPATLVDELLRLVGESIILTGQVQERTRKALRQIRAVQTQHQVFQQLTADLEQLVEIRGIATLRGEATGKGDFDPLELEQYNELNTVTHRLLEASADSRAIGHDIREDLGALDDLLVAQGRLHRESQEAVLRTRMVPVKTIVPRLQRSVRQTCRLTDKEVEFSVSGGETMMDSNLLADITDPLMHVLRNAVDHGIELPQQRQTVGKNPVGRIILAFVREGDTIAVRCRDDGAGLDFNAIRLAAEAKGLIVAGATPSESELSQLILTPGFSTRIEATQTSGRGIGLDAVQSRVRELKGSFQIRSETGRGCMMEFRLPVTLIAIHAVLVRIHNQRFAISSRGIQQILYADLGETRQIGTKTVYKIGDGFYELTSLETILNLSHDRRTTERRMPALLLVREETGATRAVMAQEVLDSRDLVVKPLGRYFPKLPGIVGATILGDGSVVPVLDLPEMLSTSLSDFSAPAQRKVKPVAATTPYAGQRMALVVDDSLSARRALAQAVEDAGFEVRTARDGLEAVAMIEARRPDLLLVDLEMPRMNGLELTAHVRGREATRGLPVIMVTSRSTAKHRREAEAVGVNFYMTKPFTDEALLQNIEAALKIGMAVS